VAVEEWVTCSTVPEGSSSQELAAYVIPDPCRVFDILVVDGEHDSNNLKETMDKGVRHEPRTVYSRLQTL
jgi:hypothetical protein